MHLGVSELDVALSQNWINRLGSMFYRMNWVLVEWDIGRMCSR